MYRYVLPELNIQTRLSRIPPILIPAFISAINTKAINAALTAKKVMTSFPSSFMHISCRTGMACRGRQTCYETKDLWLQSRLSADLKQSSLRNDIATLRTQQKIPLPETASITSPYGLS